MNKVLVLDDDADILTLVKIVLKLNGFEVETISRWEDTDEKIQSFQPDLILIDISLVGADGREICKKLKGNAATRHIAVILFSANAELGKNFKDCAAENFIAKPFEIAHLVSTVKTHIA